MKEISRPAPEFVPVSPESVMGEVIYTQIEINKFKASQRYTKDPDSLRDRCDDLEERLEEIESDRGLHSL